MCTCTILFSAFCLFIRSPNLTLGLVVFPFFSTFSLSPTLSLSFSLSLFSCIYEIPACDSNNLLYQGLARTRHRSFCGGRSTFFQLYGLYVYFEQSTIVRKKKKKKNGEDVIQNSMLTPGALW